MLFFTLKISTALLDHYTSGKTVVTNNPIRATHRPARLTVPSDNGSPPAAYRNPLEDPRFQRDGILAVICIAATCAIGAISSKSKVGVGAAALFGLGGLVSSLQAALRARRVLNDRRPPRISPDGSPLPNSPDTPHTPLAIVVAAAQRQPQKNLPRIIYHPINHSKGARVTAPTVPAKDSSWI